MDTEALSDEQIANVMLTEEETETALHDARVKKYWLLRDERILATRQAIIDEAKRQWTWQDQLAYLWVRCKELRIPDEVFAAIYNQNKEAVELLCKYFTNDKDFEIAGYHLQKGIYLHGYVGTGKTTLMRLFGRNKKGCYDLVKCLDLQNLFMRDGDVAIEAMSYNRKEPRDIRNFFQQDIGRWYDDLGTEQREVSHYGNKRNVMAEVIMNRYANRSDVALNQTHITSNIDPTASEMNIPVMEKEYGTRFNDRFREMFNVLKLEGDSLRK